MAKKPPHDPVLPFFKQPDDDGDKPNNKPKDDEPITPREPYQLARKGDLDTSHEAAEAIVPELPELQRRCFEVMAAVGPGSHHDFIPVWRERFGPVAESTVRTRVAELYDACYVRRAGTKLHGNKRVYVWEIVPPGEREAERASRQKKAG